MVTLKFCFYYFFSLIYSKIEQVDAKSKGYGDLSYSLNILEQELILGKLG
jgi:hypothetical protein